MATEKRIIIANQKLGIVTQTGLQKLWSTHPQASKLVCAFTPVDAIEFLRNCIPEGMSETTFILPLENWQSETIPRGNPLLNGLTHLWMLKIVHSLATGLRNGQPSAATLTWTGNAEAVEQGKHIQALTQQAKELGFESPVLYDHTRMELLDLALGKMAENETTPIRLLAKNNTKRIHQLITEISPEDHPVKVARMLAQVKEHIENDRTLH